MWHKIAPRLAEDFTVVAADLRGYGDSSKPPGGDDHVGYSYRAAVSIDLEHDRADLPRKIEMPMLVLWGEKSHVNRSYQPMEAWRERAADVRGKMLPCGHYPAEQVPEETFAELHAFFQGAPTT